MSAVITLPRWMQTIQTTQFKALDVALLLALSLTAHGTASALRELAMSIRLKTPSALRPGLKRLAQLPNDEQVIKYACQVIDDAKKLLGIYTEPFEVIAQTEPPRCHYKSMRLAGEAGARHWQCQHCSHTKPVELS